MRYDACSICMDCGSIWLCRAMGHPPEKMLLSTLYRASRPSSSYIASTCEQSRTLRVSLHEKPPQVVGVPGVLFPRSDCPTLSEHGELSCPPHGIYKGSAPFARRNSTTSQLSILDLLLTRQWSTVEPSAITALTSAPSSARHRTASSAQASTATCKGVSPVSVPISCASLSGAISLLSTGLLELFLSRSQLRLSHCSSLQQNATQWSPRNPSHQCRYLAVRAT